MKKDNIESVCFIGRITEISPILGADNIEQVKIGEWSCVTKKGVQRVNDLVIVCTQDAVIPEKISKLLEITSYLRSGKRVKTVKLKNIYSECLIINPRQVRVTELREGKDLQEELGIFKYEEPLKEIQIPGNKRKVKYKDNPEFEVYFKFPNIKNCDNMFEPNELIYAQRKIHGTNFRAAIVPKLKLSFLDKIKKLLKIKIITDEFLIGSHKVNISYRNNYSGYYGKDIYTKVANDNNILNLLFTLKNTYKASKVEIYGEIYGEGIQKNYDYNLKGHKLVIFDIQIDGRYLSPKEVNYLIPENLKIELVSCVEYKDIISLLPNILKQKIKGTSIPHEGVVLKAEKQGKYQRLRAVKVISPDYLIYADKNNVEDSH